MPVESRQGPIYFHSVQNQKFRQGWDRIFGKKDKPKAEETQAPKPVEALAEPTNEAPTNDAV